MKLGLSLLRLILGGLYIGHGAQKLFGSFGGHGPDATGAIFESLGLRLTAIEAARAKLLAEHKDELDTEAMAALVAELDLEEQQIRVALGEG